MKAVKTLCHKVTNHTRIFDATLAKYNHVISFFILVIDKEFRDLDGITSKTIVPAIEKLIHTTKSNPFPKYKEFDNKFYKFPSYFRRSAIACAFGKVKNCRSMNTSALAFDGSGKVERNHKKDLAIFQTGKIYHADLSASYNIGARYFIRAYPKSISEKKWLSLHWQKEHRKPCLHSFVFIRH